MLDSGSPIITLRTAPTSPFDGAIAAARTCYSPRVIGANEVTDGQRNTIGALTFDAGHHTVYQHANFEFGLENVSRQFVWTFLHSYPFYNSEQSSQRYVKLREPRAFVPPITGEALHVYEAAVVRAWDRYAELSALLKDDALAILKELRYVRPTTNPERLKQIEKDAEKRAIETARYVIPIAAFTSMVHTVSGIVLHRLLRMVNTSDTPVRGARGDHRDGAAGEGMGSRSSSTRSAWRRSPLEHVPEAAFPRPRGDGDRFAEEFDRRLGGRWSRLRDTSPEAEEIVAESVRSTFGLTADEMSDDEAHRSGDEPGPQPLSARHPQRVVSLAADAVAASRVVRVREAAESHGRLAGPAAPHGSGVATVDDVRRYVAAGLHHATVDRGQPAGQGGLRRSRCARPGRRRTGCWRSACPIEFALYVLPNAKTLRFVESGSLLALLHKWTLRTCFNAQEEIYLASMDEIEQVRSAHPRLGRHIGPPCVIRNGLISPRCTEGTHFCGVPVWRDFPAVVRRL